MKKYFVSIPVTAQVKLQYNAYIEANSEEDLVNKIMSLEMANAQDLLSSGSLMFTKKLVVDEIAAVHIMDKEVQINEVMNSQKFGFQC